MKAFLNRCKTVLSGEQGGPNVETIILISVALIIGVALIAFGGRIIEFIGRAGENVDGLETMGS